ncbi:hypothetical protein [Richelia sinica]|uniref:hypothetical protein n=1 Tax=Richelia sinica TaxID=1357545 RepID=UPI0016826E9D|nr:hypothetical protein [Richelia sinica]MBD2667345.1 hypothetical protein [Richelia sinica FACHB-800]
MNHKLIAFTTLTTAITFAGIVHQPDVLSIAQATPVNQTFARRNRSVAIPIGRSQNEGRSLSISSKSSVFFQCADDGGDYGAYDVIHNKKVIDTVSLNRGSRGKSWKFPRGRHKIYVNLSYSDKVIDHLTIISQ